MELPEISVWADCGSVYLAGTVRSYYVRQLAISLAMHVAGVVQVVDELKVGSESSRSQCDVPIARHPLMAPSTELWRLPRHDLAQKQEARGSRR